MRILEQIGLPENALGKLSQYRRLPVSNCHAERVGWVEATQFTL
jgi:hypothetical protein